MNHDIYNVGIVKCMSGADGNMGDRNIKATLTYRIFLLNALPSIIIKRSPKYEP